MNMLNQKKVWAALVTILAALAYTFWQIEIPQEELLEIVLAIVAALGGTGTLVYAASKNKDE